MNQWVEWLQFMSVLISFTLVVLGYDFILYFFMKKESSDKVNASKEDK